VTATEESAVRDALETLRPSLDADGFDLYLDSMRTDGTVVVILAARPDACLECLVPDDLLVQMIEGSIRKQSPSVGQVELVKRGFDPTYSAPD
jgi:Fe-S cluster biogenesis protein NfuA